MSAAVQQSVVCLSGMIQQMVGLALALLLSVMQPVAGQCPLAQPSALLGGC